MLSPKVTPSARRHVHLQVVTIRLVLYKEGGGDTVGTGWKLPPSASVSLLAAARGAQANSSSISYIILSSCFDSDTTGGCLPLKV